MSIEPKSTIGNEHAVGVPEKALKDAALADGRMVTLDSERLLIPASPTAIYAVASLPLTRVPGIHPLYGYCAGSGDYTGDLGDVADCYDCAVASLPADCTVGDYCQIYDCRSNDPGPTGDYYDHDSGWDPCWDT